MPPAQGRPYARMSIDELESKAKLALGGDGVRQLLIAELSHRTTPRARALLKRIQSSEGSVAVGAPHTKERDQNHSQPAVSRPAGAVSNPSVTKAATPSGKSPNAVSTTPESASVDLRFQYEQLCSLIGRDAEDLARWGLVPGTHQDIMRIVFDAWEKRVGPIPDLYGRSLSALRGIRARFKA